MAAKFLLQELRCHRPAEKLEAHEALTIDLLLSASALRDSKDLKPIGIDYFRNLPRAPNRGAELHIVAGPGIRWTELPDIPIRDFAFREFKEIFKPGFHWAPSWGLLPSS